MKAMTIEVPREGATVQLFFRGNISFGQAVIVVSEDVDVYRGGPRPENGEAAPSDLTAADKKEVEKPKVDLDAIYDSLVKLRARKRSAAVNVIKTMFQFTNPITTEAASRILMDLARRGYVNVTPTGFLEFLDGKETVAKS